MIATEAGTVEIADVQLHHVAGQLLRVVRAGKDLIPPIKPTPVENHPRGSEAPPLAELLRGLDVKDVQDHRGAVLLTLEGSATDIGRRDPDPGRGTVHRKISVAHAKIHPREEVNET